MLKKRLVLVISSLLVAFTILMTFISTSALDDKYDISDLKMSVKIPKQYYVVTRDSAENDENFSNMGLPYNETMTAFTAAHIYLQAQDHDNKLKFTITMTTDDDTKKINNYSELSDAEREEILTKYLTDSMYTDGVEKKHAGNICFDFEIKKEVDEKTLYGVQTNTVINGMNISFTLQKYDLPLSTDEVKLLSNIVDSMSFEKINLSDSGPRFDWWRVLLWLFILAVIAFAFTFIYRQYNESQKRKRMQRRNRKRIVIDLSDEKEKEEKKEEEKLEEPKDEKKDENITFDEALGYEDKDDFIKRNGTDLESLEISVKEKSSNKGFSYFEDEGESIDSSQDYFDKYFKEKTEKRKRSEKMASAIGTYIQMAFRHIGYFFKNTYNKIVGLFRGNLQK